MRILKHLLMFLGAFFVALVVALTLPFMASAATTPIGPDSTANSLLDLDPNAVGFILGAAIPFIVALVTGTATAAWIKKSLTIILSAVAGLITVSQVDGGGAVISAASFKAAAWSLVSALVVYWTTLRNSEAEAKLHEIGPALGAPKPPDA